jgi:predicted peroxiredoxin
MASPSRMLIILTTGPEDRGSRATLAFSMGTAALISGVEVSIYLTMGGTFWSREGSERAVHIPGFDPLATYIQQFTEASGKLLVCSPCDAFYCAIAKEERLRAGAERCGLAHIVDLALGSTTVTM